MFSIIGNLIVISKTGVEDEMFYESCSWVGFELFWAELEIFGVLRIGIAVVFDWVAKWETWLGIIELFFLTKTLIFPSGTTSFTSSSLPSSY